MTEGLGVQKKRGLGAFLVLWFGQSVSIIGSGLTGFALGVWLFQTTGDATPFALTALAQWVPRIVLAPVAGIVADKFPRKLVIIVADTGAALATFTAVILLSAGSLAVTHVYLIAFFGGAFSSFQDPAFGASITMLVDKKHFARAAGLRQASQALANIASPIIAGLLMVTIGLRGVILIDIASFFFAVITVAVTRIPNPEASTTDAPSGMLARASFGLRCIWVRPGLMGMMVFFALVNFIANLSGIVLMPLVLSFSDPAGLGTVQAVGGVGMLVGSLVVGVWGGPRRKMIAVYGAIALAAVGAGAVGLVPSLPFVAAASFVFLFAIPFANGPAQAIWQSKVAPDVQGRVFAARSMISTFMMPIAFGIAGPLADHVFEPMMRGAATAPAFFAAVVGAGVGRGYGLMFSLSGVLLLVATFLFVLYRPLRRVELELPDLVDEAAKAQEEVPSA